MGKRIEPHGQKPGELRLSKKVVARWGWRDGHVEVEVDPGALLPNLTLRIEPEEIDLVERVARYAKEWRDLPEAARDRLARTDEDE